MTREMSARRMGLSAVAGSKQNKGLSDSVVMMLVNMREVASKSCTIQVLHCHEWLDEPYSLPNSNINFGRESNGAKWEASTITYKHCGLLTMVRRMPTFPGTSSKSCRAQLCPITGSCSPPPNQSHLRPFTFKPCSASFLLLEATVEKITSGSVCKWTFTNIWKLYFCPFCNVPSKMSS